MLLKIAALNSLYAANVFATHAMARHIVCVFKHTPGDPGPETVEDIARPKDPLFNRRQFLSFASKYCHFFVNPDRFAICDSRALDALRSHLGSGCPKAAKDGSIVYHDFLDAVNQLRERNRLSCSYVELDRYLWLRGCWLQLQRERKDGKPRAINREAREFLKSQDPSKRALREQALGPDSAT